MVHDLSDGHAGIFDQYKVCCKNDDQYCSDLSYEAFHSIIIEGSLTYKHLIIREFGLYVPLLFAFDTFPVERLDDVHAVDDVLDSVAFLFSVCTHVPAPSLKLACLTDSDEYVDRYNHQGSQTDIRISCKHEYESQDGACEQRQEVDKEVLHCR